MNRWRGLRGRPSDGDAHDPHADQIVVTADRPALPAHVHGELGRLDLQVQGVAALAALVSVSSGTARVSDLRVEVSPWRGGGPETAVRLGHVRGLVEHSVRTSRRVLHVSLRTTEPVDVAELLAAVLHAAVPAGRGVQGSGRSDVALAAGSDAPVTAADRVVGPDEIADERVRATDVLLTSVRGAAAAVAAGMQVSDPGTVVGLVDPAVHHPIGRRDHDLPAVRARATADGGLTLSAEGEPAVVVLAPRQSLHDVHVRALRTFGRVVVDVDEPLSMSAVGALRQLSACGLVVSLPAAALPAAADPDELSRWWTAPEPVGAFAAEAASVAQRRTAHRDHSVRRVLAASDHGAVPAVSALLCTNRLSHLGQALGNVARLDYPRLQLVLGLHGLTPPADLDVLLATVRARHDVVVVPVDGAVPFGSALAALTARAEGDLVTKVDDDDVYGAQHVWDLVVAREYSGAAVVGKVSEHVYLAESDRTVRRDLPGGERYARTVAGGTMLMSVADLHAVGGWRPVPRSVDRAVLDRVLRAGAGVYRTHGLGFVYVRGHGTHTWAVDDEYFSDGAQHDWPGLVLPGDDPPPPGD